MIAEYKGEETLLFADIKCLDGKTPCEMVSFSQHSHWKDSSSLRQFFTVINNNK